MRLKLGCRRIEDALEPPVLVYGPAASGKTNLILHVLTQIARYGRVVLLSTEGYTPVPRLLELCRGRCLENLMFQSVFDVEGLLEAILEAPDDILALAVDSLNAPFRHEASPETIPVLTTVSALLASLAEKGVYTIASSQVHETESGIEPVAHRLIRPYFTSIVRLEVSEGVRRFILEEPVVIEARLRVTKSGVYVECI